MKKIFEFCLRFKKWFVYYIFDPIWYRIFGYKHHIIKTRLRPAAWYDTDVRMLYAVMELVEWFVENDMNIWSEEDKEEEIQRIDYESLSNGCDRSEEKAMLFQQWEYDKEILEIYNWWKNYEFKIEEMNNSFQVWTDYLKNNNKDFDFLEALQNEDAESNKLKYKYYELKDKLEKEENEMLKKAIDLREYMWS